MSGPHDFAVRPRRASSLRAVGVHRIPPHVRDDRETPLRWAGRGELVEMICPTGKAENFFARDWTAKISLIRLNNSRFWRIRSDVKQTDRDPVTSIAFDAR